MLDAASLQAIADEARNCFLYEDAPEYLKMLTQGIGQLQSNLTDTKNPEELIHIYKELGRAAHSIKGGAGMAEMQTVSKLAHKIEDIFEALQENLVKDPQTALQLLTLGIEELDNLIDGEINHNQDVEEANSLELILALDEFLQNIDNPDKSTEIGFANQDFIKTALTVDLDACIERVEEILGSDSSLSPKDITESLRILIEECTLLGEALNCFWLVEFASKITLLKESKKIDILELTILAIAEVKYLRSQFLEAKNPEFSEKFTLLLPQETPEIAKDKKEDKDQFSEKQTSGNNLKIPLEKVTKITNNVSELLIYHERLRIHENQLKRASLNLKKRTKELFPLKEKVGFIYDQLTITENQSSNNNLPQKSSNLEEFDSLEFDQYTEVHTALQSLTELMVQVQEIREDVDLLSREFQETLITMRQSLDNLGQDLTQIRLVPFINLAGSFFSPIEKLNKKYNKSVELIIEGKQVLIDQTIIENLRTPFNHIIRNAFDHGIESSKKREKSGKSKQGKIKLGAKLEGNNVIITITDDGNGIDIDKVFQKGLSLGLFPKNISSSQLSQEQILDLIFSPGFSTAKKVSDLSGRGMGMDIVKAEIEKLKGTIKVQTKAGKGTQFALKIPLALNLLHLLLVRCQKQTLAIPSDNVLRIIRISDHEIKDNQIVWEKQLIPFNSLYKILPYNSTEIFNYAPESSHSNIALLLKIGSQKIFLTVDAIVDEKELVTKGFDETTPVPAYVSGCTVLGTGEVVPILVPDYLKQLFNTLPSQSPEENPEKSSEINKLTNQSSILVIDDSIAVRNTLNRILTQCGYQVVECRDGKEAWNVLQTTDQHFDLAICDLEMPGFDGYKVLQLVRSSNVWRDLPIIILTSRESDLHRNKAMNLGANAYLTKPFHPLKMLEVIESNLKG